MSRVDLPTAVELLRQGRVVAVPTETVYGLAADAASELSVRQIFAVKGRPHGHPLIVHVDSVATARSLSAAWPAHADRLTSAFWPGPLTLVLPRGEAVPGAVTGGQPTVGLRMPAHPLTLELLGRTGPLAAPSANRFGRLSPTSAADVLAELGEELPVLDGGSCAVGVESTIVDLSRSPPRVLRPGGVTAESLAAVLGEPVPVAGALDMAVPAPGRLASHYAPRAGVQLVTEEDLPAALVAARTRGLSPVVLAPRPVPSAPFLALPAEPAAMARVLYARLREADALGDLILVVPPPAHGLGVAVVDRLARAAAPRQ